MSQSCFQATEYRIPRLNSGLGGNDQLYAILILLVTMAALRFLNGVMADSQPVMLALAFATGANALALGPPIQMLLIAHSRGPKCLVPRWANPALTSTMQPALSSAAFR